MLQAANGLPRGWLSSDDNTEILVQVGHPHSCPYSPST